MFDFFGERAGARTQDPVIKSHVLYRLSYALSLSILSTIIGASLLRRFRQAAGRASDHAPVRAV